MTTTESKAVLEFVVRDAAGREVDWIDPYLGHTVTTKGVHRVDNGFHVYDVVIPEGGSFVIRLREADLD